VPNYFTDLSIVFIQQLFSNCNSVSLFVRKTTLFSLRCCLVRELRTTGWKPRNMISMINKIMFAKMVFDNLHSREQHGNFLKRKRVESVLLRWAVQRSSWAKEGVQHRFSHKSDISNLRLAQTSICLVWREKSSFPCWECTWPWPHSKSKGRSRNYRALRTIVFVYNDRSRSRFLL